MNLRKLVSGLAVGMVASFGVVGVMTAQASESGLLPIATPAPDVESQPGSGMEVAVFAGGCFWGVQGVFQHVEGVKNAVSGYSGGTTADPSYEDVLSETTGHAEAVRVEFDPNVVSYGDLLQVFFSVIADPTTLNRQENDVGESYRSALFVMSDEQKRVASAYIDQLDEAGVFPGPIVTEVTDYTNFYDAEDYHQDNLYTMKVNPGYMAYFDVPKVKDFQAMYPEWYQERPTLVFASNYE